MFSALAQKLTRITSSSNLIPEIDGLRFIAIALVVFFHIAIFTGSFGGGTLSTSTISNLLFGVIGNGSRGVQLFFVISGFILGLPFARQYIHGAPRVDIKKYFLRRITRLEPPYIVTMMVCCVLLIVVGKYSFGEIWTSLLASLVYLHNILPVGPSVNGVAWSLEIEVQFYIMAPLLAMVFSLPKLWRRALMALLIIGIPLIRDLHTPTVLTLWSYVEYFFLGFLIADLYLEGFVIKLSHWGSLAIGTLLLILIVTLEMWRTPAELIFLGCVGSFYLLALTDPLWKKIVGFRWISIIGGMCYSIYLWHYIIIAGVGKPFQHVFAYYNIATSYGAFVFGCLVFVPAILLFSTLFFVVIERPCMDKTWPRTFAEAVKKRFNVL